MSTQFDERSRNQALSLTELLSVTLYHLLYNLMIIMIIVGLIKNPVLLDIKEKGELKEDIIFSIVSRY